MTLSLDLEGLTIDRNSPVPFYFQISELIARQITKNPAPTDVKLPSEPELVQLLGVSRSVVRQALGRLEQSGLVLRRRGQGSFVVAGGGLRSWRIEGSAGFFEDEFHREGRRVHSRVLRCQVDRLPLWASDCLRLAPGTSGVVLERLRYVEELLTVYDLNYLVERLAEPVLQLGYGEQESLYEVLWRDRGVRVERGTRLIDVVVAGERLAELLDTEPTAPLLMVEGVDFDSETQPFDCYRTWLRPDRMRLEVMVTSRPLAAEAVYQRGKDRSADESA
jgi:GntR family transcriptional regulator